MLEAREKSANLEYEIFMRIREEVSKYIQRLQALAQGIATVDVLQSLAVVAETQHLIRPEFGDDSQINIQKGAMLSSKRSWELRPIFQIVSRWQKIRVFS